VPLTVSTLVLTALLAAPKGGAPTIPLERYELDNGLKIVLSEDHSAPIVTTYITYNVGAAAEEKGSTGFAHLFEHMMFNGSENVPEGAYSWYIDGTGGILNGNTEPDRTNYFQTVPSNFLEGVLWLEASRMSGLELTDESLDNEKSVVKEEVRQQQNNQPFMKTILLDWPATAFSSWQYSHSIYGSMEDLSNAPVQAFKDFFAKYYVPNNATLVIVGDFDKAKAKSLVAKHFAGIPKGPETTYEFPEEPEQKEAVYKKVEDPLAPIPAVLVSWDIPAPRTKDRDAIELLAAVLTNGASARLPKKLVDEEKLALQVIMQAGFPIPTYGPGQMAAFLIPGNNVDPEKLREAFWAELHDVQKNGVSKAELKRARAKIKKQHIDSLGSTLFKAMQLGTYEAFFGGADKFQGDYKRFDKIKPADLKRVANDYLNETRSVTFDIVPGGGGAAGMMGGPLGGGH
jgi:predicted Zn-dependent peptidase